MTTTTQATWPYDPGLVREATNDLVDLAQKLLKAADAARTMNSRVLRKDGSVDNRDLERAVEQIQILGTRIDDATLRAMRGAFS